MSLEPGEGGLEEGVAMCEASLVARESKLHNESSTKFVAHIKCEHRVLSPPVEECSLL
jgi:hypothetical protein